MSSSSSKGKGPELTDEEDTTNDAAGEEEDTGAQVTPIVKLKAVAVSTGEEDENAILDLKAKLYRFDKDSDQWKERGAGSVKLLKHKVTNKVRLLMRQAKTLKICANHWILPTISIQEHVENEKSCIWRASDFSDGVLKDELFCMKFQTIDIRRQFMKTVQQVAESQLNKNRVTVSRQDKEENGVAKSPQAVENKVAEAQQDENEDASNAARMLENLSVEDRAQKGEPESKSEVKKEEAPASST
uniref:ran-binding protein 1 homolog b-like n=1 Tax=Erigeron canadensis TaxID=72917 RepID=UPI001CB8B11D|nr:ran-binding protein 1 homolog b-like [Erigeron canadensis]